MILDIAIIVVLIVHINKHTTHSNSNHNNINPQYSCKLPKGGAIMLDIFVLPVLCSGAKLRHETL